MTTEDSITFRKFTRDDIPFGMLLKAEAGWNQLPGDWNRFLAHDPEGAFVALEEGTPAGTVTTTRYGDRFGWVGMVLVPQVKRRRGIGTALLNKAISHLQTTGVEAVRLDATPAGKQVYDRMGFKDEYHLERRQVTASSGGTSDARPMSRADLEKVVAYDAPVFGSERSNMLSLLYEQRPELCFWMKSPFGDLTGYVMARPGANAFQIGPWIAGSEPVAEQLLRAVLNALDGEAVFLDVQCAEPQTSLVTQYGFEPQRPFIRMFLGENKFPGCPEMTFAIAGVETG
ncbi:MAG: GNAT family N-acetyltransferase [Planctomycetota bacterium]|nr:GNAT family N-acetyltransferase [Planctomycetota bacterium]